MEFTEKDVKRFFIIILLVLLAVLVFLTLRPVILSVIGGLLLAYVFLPVFKFVKRFVKNETLSAWIVCIGVVLITLTLLWFLVPVVVQQIFQIFTFSQSVDMQGVAKAIFPTASEQFITQLTITTNSFISSASSGILSSLVNIFIDVPNMLLNLFILSFVFFYTMRDSARLAEFTSSISPFNKAKEKLIVKQFRDITDSIVYGQVIVGLVQGGLAGIGMLIFGVDNALVLTVIAIILSIIPVIGPGLVWVPVAIYLFAAGNPAIAIGFLLYNILIVSTIDNILRLYIVSRRIKLSPAIVSVGMVGGLFVFGILGLVLGPLIIAYFITFLRAYKEKAIHSLFSEEDN